MRLPLFAATLRLHRTGSIVNKGKIECVRNDESIDRSEYFRTMTMIDNKTMACIHTSRTTLWVGGDPLENPVRGLRENLVASFPELSSVTRWRSFVPTYEVTASTAERMIPFASFVSFANTDRGGPGGRIRVGRHPHRDPS
jgi:hypothetical protein